MSHSNPYISFILAQQKIQYYHQVQTQSNAYRQKYIKTTTRSAKFKIYANFLDPPPPSLRGKGASLQDGASPEGERQHKYYTMQFLNEEIYADININILIFLLGCVHDDAGLLASGM